MKSRKEAIELATAHLSAEGSGLAVHETGLRRDKQLGLWAMDYYDPEHPEEVLIGGFLLVWDDGRVEPASSADPNLLQLRGEHMKSLEDALALPEDWLEVLGGEWLHPYWDKLQAFLREERAEHTVVPPEELVFNAFKLTRYADTRVVILGQDPYHEPDEAHGLCFSVPDGVRRPRSIINIHKELQADLSIDPPEHGNLEAWARQGVLLLNTVLTTRLGSANKHQGRGWEEFTDHVIQAVNAKAERVVFILWGGPARAKKKLIDRSRHAIIEAAHPTSWASAHDPFLGSQPFSKTNALLREANRKPIDWEIAAR